MPAMPHIAASVAATLSDRSADDTVLLCVGHLRIERQGEREPVGEAGVRELLEPQSRTCVA